VFQVAAEISTLTAQIDITIMPARQQIAEMDMTPRLA
jgi:hypothetical protein